MTIGVGLGRDGKNARGHSSRVDMIARGWMGRKDYYGRSSNCVYRSLVVAVLS